jgi:hypothetical protein
MDAFGATIGPGMVAMAKQAEIATRTIGLFKDGILNQVTIGAGAILAELGDRFGELGISWKSLGKTIVDVAEVVAQTGNVIWESWSNPAVLSGIWEAFKAGFKVLGGYLESSIVDAVGRAFKAIGSGLGGAGDKLIASAEATRSWASGRDTFAFKMSLQDIVDATKNGDKLREIFEGARERINAVGKAATENNPFEIWMRSAKEWETGNKTSFEGLFERINRAKFLLDPANGPGLSALGRGRLGSSLFNDLKQFMPTYQPVGAMEFGSREAYSAVNEYRGAGRDNIQDAIKAAVEEANRQQQEQIRIAEETLRAIENGKVIVVKGMNG